MLHAWYNLLYINTYMYIHVDILLQVYVYTNVNMYIRVNMMHVHKHRCIHIHTLIYIYIYAYIHIYRVKHAHENMLGGHTVHSQILDLVQVANRAQQDAERSKEAGQAGTRMPSK